MHVHTLRCRAFSRSSLKGTPNLFVLLKAGENLPDTAKTKLLQCCLPLALQIGVGARALVQENDQACEAEAENVGDGVSRKRRSGACSLGRWTGKDVHASLDARRPCTSTRHACRKRGNLARWGLHIERLVTS